MSLSIYCPYCLKFTEISRAKNRIRNYSTDRYEEKDVNWFNNKTKESWWIGKRNSCEEPMLILNEGEKIYPTPQPAKTDERVPISIRNDMDEAKRCMTVSAYNAASVMARRVIQSTCMSKGAAKKTLFEQIIELTGLGIITTELKDWANEVRFVGNDGAHPSENEIQKKDAEDILELAEQFLQVIFVTPSIAQERKSKRTT